MHRICISVVLLCCLTRTYSSNNYTPTGARSSALAGASLTLQDVWSTSNNQAALGFHRSYSAGAYYENSFLIKELGTRVAALSIPFKYGTVGMLFSNFGYNLYQQNRYALCFGKSFEKKLAMGIAIDYINIRLGDSYGNKSMLVSEFGILSNPTEKLSIGAHIYNPARIKLADYNNERIATVLRIGVRYRFSGNVILLTEAEKDISNKAIIKTAVEYRPFKELYLRMGLSTNPISNSFGIGLNLNQFQIDIAAKYHQSLGYSTQLGLLYNYSKKNETPVATN